MNVSFSQTRAPPGTTVIPIILASDKTTLTSHTGGKNAHPLYLTLGNIRKGVRASINQKAYVLLAYIPILETIKRKVKNKSMKNKLPGILSKRLYHKSLDKILSPLRRQEAHQPPTAIDSDGYQRRTWRILMGWIADMEEVWTILCIGHFVCPFCEARKCQLDCKERFPARTSASILSQLASVREVVSRRSNADIGSLDDTWAFANAAKKVGLGGVEVPCWAWMVEAPWNVDIVKVISHDLLHWYHKAFRDYIVTWNQNIIDSESERSEIDVRLRLQIPRPGFRHFTYGISGISQWTQGDTRDLEKEFLGAVAGAPRATASLLSANRAYLDYVYLATYPYHTEDTLAEAQHRVDDFKAARDIYARLGGRISEETGAAIEGFQIPKLHVPQHFPDYVRWKGTLDGSTTETSERLHIDVVKDAWRATNHRDSHLLQMLRWLDLRERMIAFGLYMEWWDGIEMRETENEGGLIDEVVVGKQTRLRRAWQVPDPSKDNVDYKLAKRPHSPGKPLADVISANQLPNFLIDLQAYLTQKGVPGIPDHFAYLDIWTHVHLLLPIPNDFLKAEWRKVRANPMENTYDTVLINDGDADVVGLSGEFLRSNALALLMPSVL